ncbi:hypothetical protein LOK49_LG10G01181 [Camellia lanceoleosa]|uniref:Uncharacterized protein n=1 Tax=Camellia lanceoleosa TaxID=1840588 RepID=A0ACC0G9J1_9ERIC|nr:hypothetical protein LOK49_LG10G01181 [Camellia lanceoleosa]
MALSSLFFPYSIDEPKRVVFQHTILTTEDDEKNLFDFKDIKQAVEDLTRSEVYDDLIEPELDLLLAKQKYRKYCCLEAKVIMQTKKSMSDKTTFEFLKIITTWVEGKLITPQIQVTKVEEEDQDLENEGSKDEYAIDTETIGQQAQKH